MTQCRESPLGELLSYMVTVIGLPLAIFTFWHEQRKERENEDEETYQLLSDAIGAASIASRLRWTETLEVGQLIVSTCCVATRTRAESD